MNPYEVLQVSPVADAAVIRAAYRSLIQRYHPDRNPGDVQAAQHAVRVTQAYELLADPDRRAAYDRHAQASRAAPLAWPDAPSRADRFSRQPGTAMHAKTARASWAVWVAALLLMVCLGWALKHMGWGQTSPASPEKQLAEIRMQVDSAQTSEAQRRVLLAQRQTLLAQDEGLFKADSAMRTEQLAARSMALLSEPIAISLVLPAGVEGSRLQLSIPEITLVLGSFDAPKLKDHVAQHRSRIVQDLMQKLSAQAATTGLGADAQGQLRRIIRESVMSSLDINPSESYPSTYFESPGRYGVVEVVLPQNFLLIKEPT